MRAKSHTQCNLVNSFQARFFRGTGAWKRWTFKFTIIFINHFFNPFQYIFLIASIYKTYKYLFPITPIENLYFSKLSEKRHWEKGWKCLFLENWADLFFVDFWIAWVQADWKGVDFSGKKWRNAFLKISLPYIIFL